MRCDLHPSHAIASSPLDPFGFTSRDPWQTCQSSRAHALVVCVCDGGQSQRWRWDHGERVTESALVSYLPGGPSSSASGASASQVSASHSWAMVMGPGWTLQGPKKPLVQEAFYCGEPGRQGLLVPLPYLEVQVIQGIPWSFTHHCLQLLMPSFMSARLLQVLLTAGFTDLQVSQEEYVYSSVWSCDHWYYYVVVVVASVNREMLFSLI